MARTASSRRILVVDDDPKIGALVSTNLRTQGYEPHVVLDGQEALETAASLLPSLVLLDLAMPVMGGIETLVRLREWYQGPIIILSATDEEREKVRALDLGADDYLTKPFGVPELLARVRTALRRADRAAAPADAGRSVITGDLTIDLAKRRVTRNGEEVYLTRTEYELLRILASNAGKILTHRQLLQQAWGPEYGQETEYLRTFIKQLRRKLEPDPSRPTYLVTQPGVGYRLVA